MADDLGKKISELPETTDLQRLYTIGTDKNTSSKKVSLEFLRQAADYANAQGDYAKSVGDTVAGNVGATDYPVFSASGVYAIGDVVRYADRLYRFTAPHQAGAWNGSDVELTSINEEAQRKIAELESETNELESVLGIINVDSFTKENKTYSLFEAIALVPQKMRWRAKGISYAEKDGRIVIALFQSHLYNTGWENVSNWKIIDVETILAFQRIVGLDSISGVVRTNNVFNYIEYPKLSKYVYPFFSTMKYTENSKSISFKLCDVDANDKLWCKIWSDLSYDDYGIDNNQITVTILDGKTFDDGTKFTNDSYSHAVDNKRGNIVASVSGIAVMSIKFLSKELMYQNIIPLLKTLTVFKNTGYGSQYIGYWQIEVEEENLSESLKRSISNIPNKVDKNQGLANVGKVLVIDNNGNIVPGEYSPNENLTGIFKEQGIIKIPIGENLLTTKVLGNGWTESNSVYTHTAGTEEIVFDYNTISGKKYLLVMEITNPLEDNLYVTLGDYPKVDTYNGSNKIIIGFLSVGGNLRIIPNASWNGTITSIKLCEVVSEDIADEIVDYDTGSVGNYNGVNDLTSFWNVAISGTRSALESTQNSTRNIAIGINALRDLITGTRNVAVGTFALANLQYGDRNVAIGSDSLWFVKHAEDCVSIGKNSIGKMQLLANFKRCTALGGSALAGTDGGAEDCVAVGYTAMAGTNSRNPIPKKVVAVGVQAGFYAGDSCTYVGHRAGYYQKGKNNTCLGAETQTVYVTGSKQTLIGSNARPIPIDTTPSASNIVTIDNCIAIGADAVAEKSNQAVIGNKDITETKVFGNLVVEGADGIKRQIIFNSDGTCSWQTL